MRLQGYEHDKQKVWGIGRGQAEREEADAEMDNEKK